MFTRNLWTKNNNHRICKPGPNRQTYRGTGRAVVSNMIRAIDLDGQLNSRRLQLADDLKISRKTESKHDRLILQDEINALGCQCDMNRTKLIVAKCSILTVTLKSVKLLQEYTAADVIMDRVSPTEEVSVIFDVTAY